jgi:formate dehydrogenase accessory protein FdhE
VKSTADRIARASRLAGQYPAAAEILTFYARLAEYQRSLSGGSKRTRPTSHDFVDDVDLDAAAAAVPDFLRWLESRAPATLAGAAGQARDISPDEWRALMRETVLAGQSRAFQPSRTSESPLAFIAEAVLQPFAEAAARQRREPGRPGESPARVQVSRCPICAGLPVVGALHEEGHGARRTLQCGLCLSEWDYVRLRCPSCEEEQFDALPVYTSEAFPHVRIEACDSCRMYLKTIDLTKDGLAVPLVDDLASLTLDLWAVEQGYRRVRDTLLRTTGGFGQDTRAR